MFGRIVMKDYGPPSVLRWERAAPAAVAPGDIVIRTIAAAINHSDLEIRAGNWPILRAEPFPYVPGLEVVGEVISRGDSVSSVAVGDRVITMMQGLGGVRAERDGGYSELVTVEAENVAVVPQAVDPLELAAVGLAGVTAFGGLERLGELDRRRVMISGAAGGVGSAAVSLAKLAGAEVVAIAGREEQRNYLHELGADEVIIARTSLLPQRADGVLDTVGGPLFPGLVKSLSRGGRLSLVGAVGGAEVVFDAYDLTSGIVLTGYSTEDLTGPSLRAAIKVIARGLEKKVLRGPKQTVLPLSEASRAHELLEGHGVSGRILLVP